MVGAASMVLAKWYPEHICYQTCSMASVINIVQGLAVHYRTHTCMHAHT